MAELIFWEKVFLIALDWENASIYAAAEFADKALEEWKKRFAKKEPE